MVLSFMAFALLALRAEKFSLAQDRLGSIGAYRDYRHRQAEQGTHTRLNKGQTFAEEPRGNPDPMSADNADVAAPQSQPSTGAPDPATGMAGVNGGIETQRIEP